MKGTRLGSPKRFTCYWFSNGVHPKSFFKSFFENTNEVRIIVIYWMMIISFIFHYTRDLVFHSGIIKVLREVKNKGYESHPILNFTWLQVFMPPKAWKKRVQKIKTDATQNNSVPLELGKQLYTGEKRNDWTDQQSFSPSLDNSEIMEDECMPRSQLRRPFGFFSSAPGWWGILKPASTKPPWPRSSCKQKGWMTSPSKTALFFHHDGWAGIKI